MPSRSGPAAGHTTRRIHVAGAHVAGVHVAVVVTTVATTVVVAFDGALSNAAHVLLVAVACAAYLVLVLRRSPSGIGIRLVGAAIAVQTVVAVARPPGATEDLWWYAIYGRMVAVYHASPYTHTPADFPHDPLLTLVGHTWRHTPSVYGPLFTAWSAIVSALVGTSAFDTRLVYQLLAAGALLAICVVLWRQTRAADAVALVALNPVTAIYLVNGGRNDLLVGAALLGAVVLVGRDRATAAGVVGALGALVKLTGMVGVVALVVSLLVRRRFDAARRVGITAALVVAGAYVVTGPMAALTPMHTAGSRVSRVSLWRGLGTQGISLPSPAVMLVVLAALVVGVLVAAARRGPEVAVPATTTALTLGASYTLPGYVAWAMPTAALRPHGAIARVVAAQGVLLVLAYEVARHPLGSQFGHTLRQIADLAAPVGTLALVSALVWSVRTSGRSRAGRSPSVAPGPAPAARGGC